ncbi:carbohydrate ABC transporter permease [candidate division KSB1 bacterium]|nr:carbohydrate ABC transporter permease [candidate division KSB1 bacterium]
MSGRLTFIHFQKSMNIKISRAKIFNLSGHLILGMLLLLTFYPFLFMLISATKSIPQFYQNFWGISYPLHWENYVEAWETISRHIGNSILVSGVTLIGVLTLGSITAYIFARFDFFGKQVLFYALLALLMVPGILTLIPAFMVVKQLHLLDRYWVLILPYLSGGQVFAIFLLRAFFESVPRDLFDAATIDGASEFRILRHVVIPLSRPILGTVAIMNLLGTWNEFIWPYVTLQSPEKFVLPLSLLSFASLYGVKYGTMFASYTLAALPLLLLFVFTTRTFIKGISSGAVKF